MRLTKKQKTYLFILNKHGMITTDPPSRNHNTMLSLVKKGLAIQGDRFKNIFTPAST